MRGTVSGSLWGLVVGGVCLGLASQVGELPVRAPALAAPEMTVDTDTTMAVSPSATATPDAPELPEAPDVVAAADDTTAVETTQPDIAQEVVVAPDMTAPAEEDLPPAIATEDQPVTPTDQGAQQPPLVAEDTPKIDRQPATPAAVAEVDTDVAVADIASPTTGTVTPDLPVAADDTPPALAAPADDVAVASDAVETAPIEAPATEAEIPAIEIVEPPAIAGDTDITAPDTPGIELVTPDVIEAPEADIAFAEPAPEPRPLVTPAPEEETVPEVEPETTDAASEEQPTLAPAAPAPTVRVNRPGAEPTEQAGQESEVVTEDALPEDAPALLRYATMFENPDSLPMLSLVMVDDPANPGAPGQVADLGFPVTVILNPLVDGAGDRMAAYRAAGVEVGIRATLPGGATPADVEVAFEAAFAAIPDAVVLFSDGNDGVQGSRSVTEQVVEVLAADGRGLVTVQRGLGNAVRIAEQADVPAAPVLRDLDGDGQSASAIGRALDQAAFRARQSGDAVLLAQVSGDTLDALADWGGKVDGDQFLLAPVTAILRDQIAPE